MCDGRGGAWEALPRVPVQMRRAGGAVARVPYDPVRVVGCWWALEGRGDPHGLGCRRPCRRGRCSGPSSTTSSSSSKRSPTPRRVCSAPSCVARTGHAARHLRRSHAAARTAKRDGASAKRAAASSRRRCAAARPRPLCVACCDRARWAPQVESSALRAQLPLVKSLDRALFDAKCRRALPAPAPFTPRACKPRTPRACAAPRRARGGRARRRRGTRVV